MNSYPPACAPSTSAASTQTNIDHDDLSTPKSSADKFIQFLGERYGQIQNKRKRRKLELAILEEIVIVQEEEEEESEQFH